MSLSRRGFIGLAVTGLAGSLAACGTASTIDVPSSAGGGSSSAAPVRATIGLTYVPNIQFSPFYVAEASGLYKTTGATVTLRHHGASEGLFTALAGGSEDFVVAGADEMLQARAQGLDLVAIAQFYRSYPVVGIVKEASPITSAADLKGRSIGVPGKFGESWFGLKVLLASGGLTEADVKVIDTQYTQVAALRGDKVDAIMGFSNNDAVVLALDGVAVRTLPLTSGSLPLVGISLITTQKYLDAHPAVAKAVVAACMGGVKAVVKDPAAAVKTSEDYITTLKSDAASRTAAAKTLDATIPLLKDASGAVTPAFDAAQFAAMATFLKDQGLVAASVDPTKAMSNAYQS